MAQPRDQLGRFMRDPTVAEMNEVGLFAEMEGWIAGSAAVREAKIVLALEVRDYWKSIAPVRGDKDPHGQWGDTHDGSHEVGSPEDYVNSIKVIEKGPTVAVGTSLVPLCDWLEYGSIHNPEHGYGARVLAHFGGGPVDGATKLFVG